MKNILILLLIILASGFLKAQEGPSSKRKNIFSLKAEKSEHILKIKNIRNTFRIEKKEYSAFHFLNRTFHPKVSVDLLDGSGIHLFSVSDTGLLPGMSIGARFKAGIIINI